jgi:uncharacterized SAM-binding protein YcdF (DUF218 family)
MQVTTDKTVRKKKLIRALIILVLLIIAAWLYGLTKYVGNLATKSNDDLSVTDGIVTFTGGTMRLEAGITLLNSEKGERLLVSGVGERTSLDVMLILSGKLPDNILELKKRIDLGYEAKNTHGNAVEVAKWVKNHNYKTIRLVTANYHMPRSYFELSREMPGIKIIKNPVFPEEIKLDGWWRNGITKKIMISEYNKYIARRITAGLGI